MIRQLIIPGIIAAAAHAALLIEPPQTTQPQQVDNTGFTEFKLDELPPIPVIPDNDPPEKDRVVVEMSATKPPPFVPDTMSTAIDNPFTVTYQPMMNVSQITGDITMQIPPGNYGNPATTVRDLGIFDPSQLDNKPRTIFQSAPDYPYGLKNRGETGEVLVTFTVDERGYVQDPRVVRSSHPDFDAPTLRAVAKWRFEPGRNGGKRVKFRMSVPVSFTLNDEA